MMICFQIINDKNGKIRFFFYEILNYPPKYKFFPSKEFQRSTQYLSQRVGRCWVDATFPFNLSNFQTFKLSTFQTFNFQPFKLSNFQTFKLSTFNLSNLKFSGHFVHVDGRLPLRPYDLHLSHQTIEKTRLHIHKEHIHMWWWFHMFEVFIWLCWWCGETTKDHAWGSGSTVFYRV